MILRALTLVLTTLCSTLSLAATPIETIKIGLLYTGDSFPFFLAQEQNYFKAEGINVELVDFMSALERDTAFLTGQVDLINGDLVGASLMFAKTKGIRVIAQTLGDDLSLRLGTLLARKGYDPNAKTLNVGMSQNTIIEYMADRLIERANIPKSKVNKIFVPNILSRLDLLLQGKLDLAALPEPLGSYAVVQGGQLIADDSGRFYGHSVLMVTDASLEKKKPAILKMMNGMYKAVADINKNPEPYRQKIAQRCRVPEAIQNSFFLYRYTYKKLPLPDLFADIQNWLVSEKKLPTPVAYTDLVRQIWDADA